MFLMRFLVVFLAAQFVNANSCSEDEKPKVISFLDDHYLLQIISEPIGSAPDIFSFKEGDIFFAYNETSYVVREGKKIESLKYKIVAENRKQYIYPDGTIVVNDNGNVTLNYHSNTKVVKIVTDIGYTVSYMGVDLDKNRVFLFSVMGLENSLKTKLHVFDLEGLDTSGGMASAEHISKVGDNIVAVSVDKLSGNIALCQRINNRYWRFKTLEKIKKLSCKSKKSNTRYNRVALESSAEFAGTEILRLYEDAIGIISLLPNLGPNVETNTGGKTGSAEIESYIPDESAADADAPRIDVRMAESNSENDSAKKDPYAEVANMLKRQLAFTTRNSKTLHNKIESLVEKLNNNVSLLGSQVNKNTLMTVRPDEINMQIEYVCAQKKDFMVHFSVSEENKSDLKNVHEIISSVRKDLSDISEISYVLQGVKPE